MHRYLFVFGNTPQLSHLELTTVLSRFQLDPIITNLSERVVLVETIKRISLEKTQEELGGTVKIGAAVGELNSITVEGLLPYLEQLLTKDHKNTFGLSIFAKRPLSFPFCRELKSQLSAQGFSVRFVAKDQEVASVVIRKEKAIDLILVPFEGKWIVGVTMIAQDFEEWSNRDYGRPHADSKRGMLPLKIARMMLNIAVGSRNFSDVSIFDPFCGMGTIVSEAVLLGASAAGIDIDKASVLKAQQNLSWLTKRYGLKTAVYELRIGDALKSHEVVKSGPFDCIVTEPFLGPPVNVGQRVTEDEIDGVFRKLFDLYIGAFKNWQNVLKDEAVVMIIFPHMKYFGEKSDRFVKNIIDSCEKLGYTLETEPIIYAREQAFIQRNICIFKFKKN